MWIHGSVAAGVRLLAFFASAPPRSGGASLAQPACWPCCSGACSSTARTCVGHLRAHPTGWTTRPRGRACPARGRWGLLAVGPLLACCERRLPLRSSSARTCGRTTTSSASTGASSPSIGAGRAPGAGPAWLDEALLWLGRAPSLRSASRSGRTTPPRGLPLLLAPAVRRGGAPGPGLPRRSCCALGLVLTWSLQAARGRLQARPAAPPDPRRGRLPRGGVRHARGPALDHRDPDDLPQPPVPPDRVASRGGQGPPARWAGWCPYLGAGVGAGRGLVRDRVSLGVALAGPSTAAGTCCSAWAGAWLFITTWWTAASGAAAAPAVGAALDAPLTGRPLWEDGLPPGPEAGSASAERTLDVVVVGGGLAGLSTAYHALREAPGLRVAVLEAGRIGAGASGRNTGMVGPGVGPEPGRAGPALRARGRARALRGHARRRADGRELIRREGIDCALEESGSSSSRGPEETGSGCAGQAELMRPPRVCRTRPSTTARLRRASGCPVDAGPTGRAGRPAFRHGRPGPSGEAGHGPGRPRARARRGRLPGRGACGRSRTAAPGAGPLALDSVRRRSPGVPCRPPGGRGHGRLHAVAGALRAAASCRSICKRWPRRRSRPRPWNASAGRDGRGSSRLRRVFNYFRLTADDRLVFGGGAPRYPWRGAPGRPGRGAGRSRPSRRAAARLRGRARHGARPRHARLDGRDRLRDGRPARHRSTPGRPAPASTCWGGVATDWRSPSRPVRGSPIDSSRVCRGTPPGFASGPRWSRRSPSAGSPAGRPQAPWR